MDRESVCCQESNLLCNFRGSKQCATETDLFQHVVLSREGLEYSRFLFSRNLPEHKREQFENIELTNKNYRFTAYGAFINVVLSSQHERKNVRYVLPSCVVSAVRENFPDPEEEYTGFVCFSSEKSTFLP